MFEAIASIGWKSIAVGILVTAAVGLISVSGYKVYTIIHEDGIKDGLIVIQQNTLDNQAKTIQTLNNLIEINNNAVKLRDQQLNEINKQIDALSENLGTTQDDQAPESIKELLRRLP